MFKLDKLDLIIGSPLTLASQLYAIGLKPEDVAPVFELDDKSLVGNFLALNKQTNPEIVTKLQNALNLIKTSNEIDSIVARYIGVSDFSNESLPSHIERCVNNKANY